MLLLAMARSNLKAERRNAQSEFARVSTLSIMHCARHVVTENLSFVRGTVTNLQVGSWELEGVCRWRRTTDSTVAGDAFLRRYDGYKEEESKEEQL